MKAQDYFRRTAQGDGIKELVVLYTAVASKNKSMMHTTIMHPTVQYSVHNSTTCSVHTTSTTYDVHDVARFLFLALVLFDWLDGWTIVRRVVFYEE